MFVISSTTNFVQRHESMFVWSQTKRCCLELPMLSSATNNLTSFSSPSKILRKHMTESHPLKKLLAILSTNGVGGQLLQVIISI